MARFVTAALPPPAPQPGVHVARIVRAKERPSEAGNTVLAMVARFPDQSELGFAVTFVERASKLVGFFCRSLDIELPPGAGIELDLRPEHVLARVFYPVVELDGEGLEAVSKITKFLSRSEALKLNPALSQIQVREQVPLRLQPATDRKELL